MVVDGLITVEFVDELLRRFVSGEITCDQMWCCLELRLSYMVTALPDNINNRILPFADSDGI